MSNQFLFANARTTLSAALAASSSATSMAVATGTGAQFGSIGANQQIALVLRSQNGGSAYEVVYATAVSGDTFTIARGQEGTSPQAWNVGDIVLCGPTAGAQQSFGQMARANTWAAQQTFTGANPVITGPSGTFRSLRLQTNDSPRWDLTTDGSAETGANSGTNFEINRFADDGTYRDTPLSINRATGDITLGSVSATSFDGPLTGDVTGDVTGNVSGSSGSCTGNSATATNANYATSAGTANNADALGGVAPSGWVQNNGGTYEINITGNAGYATSAGSANSANNASTVNGKTITTGTFGVGATSDASANYGHTYNEAVIPVISFQYGGGTPAISNPPYVTTYSNTGFSVHNPSSYGVEISWIVAAE